MTEVTYYRWRSEYGGLKGDQVKRLKELETAFGISEVPEGAVKTREKM